MTEWIHGSAGSTTFDYHWKSMEFCEGLNVPTLFQNLQKRSVCSVQGSWHSPNTLHTIVHGQAFCIITWQRQSRGCPVSATQDRVVQLSVYVPREPSPVHSCYQLNYYSNIKAENRTYRRTSAVFRRREPLD